MHTDIVSAPVSSLNTELHHLKDALGLQLHLGRKDAAQLWERVGPALTKMEQELKLFSNNLATKRDEARLQAHLGLAGLKARWPSVENGISDLIEEFHGATAGVATKLDAARVQAHLANMEAGEKASAATTSLKAAAADLDAQGAAAATELHKRVVALRARLANETKH